MLMIAALLVSVGAFSEPELPQGFSSQRQLLGINLLLILLPPYFLVAWGLSLRRSVRLLGEVDALLGSDEFAGAALTPAKFLVLGAVIGLLYAVAFNIPVATVGELLGGGALLVCVVLLIIVVWATAGLVLASRLHTASVFRHAGRRVPVDAYEVTPLEPFARSGMGDVVVVIGALVLATVQSIDAMFRYENYFYTMIVAVPAALVLLLLPMQTLHVRLKDMKQREMAAVRDTIRAMPKTLTADNTAALETMLRRRDRIEALATWPMNVAMISRLVFYGVIPPAAWVGAALVERLVGQILEN